MKKIYTLSSYMIIGLSLSACNQEPFLNAGVTAIFNPQLNVTDACPILRLKVESDGSPAISTDFSPASINNSGYKNGYALRGFPFHTNQGIFVPKMTLQCVKARIVVGESIREGRPADAGKDKSVSAHISAPKDNQTYVGTYTSRTGIAPVIEVGSEISVDWR